MKCFQGAALREGLFGRGPGRVVVSQQELPSLLVPDASDLPVEQRGRAGVVGVMVRVDEVSHLVAHAIGGGDRVDRALDVVTGFGESANASVVVSAVLIVFLQRCGCRSNRRTAGAPRTATSPRPW